MDGKPDTKKQIMDIAENLLLERGYNAFSYRDISLALKMKNASIHYHYPQKADLGSAIVERATERFAKWSGKADRSDLSCAGKLDGFCRLFKKFVDEKKICLGGALETDFETLPEGMQDRTRRFVAVVHEWLTRLLAEGKRKGEFQFPGSAKDQALLIVASLQGVIQIVRATTPACFEATARQIRRQVCS